MDDHRLDRLEDKVDKIEEVVIVIKTEMRHYNDKVESHLISDAGIIKTIAPILDKLPQIVAIVEEYQYNDKKKREKAAKLKEYTMKFGLVATIVGTITAIIKVM